MRGVPISPIEDADGVIIVGGGEVFVEANESDFVVDLPESWLADFSLRLK